MSEEKTITFKSGACIEFFGEDDGSSFIGFNSSVVNLDDEKYCDRIENDGE